MSTVTMTTITKTKGVRAVWKWCLPFLFACLSLQPNYAQQAVNLHSIGFANLPGDSIEVRLDFDGAPPQPSGFAQEDPARISIDLSNVQSSLAERRFDIDSNNAQSVMILETTDRTRLVFNLSHPVDYETRIEGNTLVVRLGSGIVVAAAAPAGSSAAAAPVSISGLTLADVTFRRGSEPDEGLIVISLSSDQVLGNVEQIGTRIYLEFAGTDVPERLNRRFDVTDFATPVNTVDVYPQRGNATIAIDLNGEYEYVAYQQGRQYTISVTPPGATTAGADPASVYSGTLVSLSFQNIDVRSVLQLLADENNLNLVASDAISGNITLQLQDVPWDQALNLVLQSRNLDKRLVGNVLYVAPAGEIAAQEQQALDASRQAQALAPLHTEFVQVNYADAANILTLLTGSSTGSASTSTDSTGGVPEFGNSGVLSSRGTATVDARTNIIIIRDVAEKLEEVRRLLSRLDVPVRQVLIEARIVNVSTDFGRDLGIRWGGAGRTDSRDGFRYGGSQASTLEQQNNRVAESIAIREALAAGESARVTALQDGTDPSLIGAIVAQAIAAVPIPIGTTSFPDALAIDLGVQDESASSFSVGFTSNSGLIELELSALESSGNGEVIARPKVTTQDKVTATIQSGVRIPYQAQAGGTAGGSTTEFVDAVLSLEVTPQITPDGRIIMQLDIHQDSVAAGSGNVPAINTNSINTSVLVENGDTIVLGGVFREETTTTETKTPVLGDVPYLGRLFKRTNNSNRRTELLIFITPRIIAEINTR
ncbi:MAG: type IV pilus secretin PilQ [Gammaproteobacteria bacterium]|nr:type IV pilus secretin PilQ [Gammaproteobacteria bacterium]MDP2139886.1 type IV pilus secretin PilQ [Gammaproteobacteria bacterium]MDP2347706.1 type IV pilus secretin PilQ [Gammaproteobacteria bacterium]